MEGTAEKVIKVTELVHGNIGKTAEFNNEYPIYIYSTNRPRSNKSKHGNKKKSKAQKQAHRQQKCLELGQTRKLGQAVRKRKARKIQEISKNILNADHRKCH